MSEEKFQDAMKKRLARLSSMPVDMSGVEKGVKTRIFDAELNPIDAGLTPFDSEMRAKQSGFAQAAAGQESRKSSANDSKTSANDNKLSANDGSWSANESSLSANRDPLKLNEHQTSANTSVRALRFWRPLAAVAAGLVLVAIVGMALLQGQPAQASDMVQLHRDIVSGKVHTMAVESVAEVNEAFAAFGTNGVKIEAPQMAVMSCCMQQVGSKQVYCVLMKEEGVPVTLTIADAGAVEAPKSAAVMHKGEAFRVEAHGELTMVTTERGGRRVCLIGALAAERLMGLAEGLKL